MRLFIAGLILLTAAAAYGQGRVTLDTPEVLDVPTATHLNLDKVIIEKGRITVEYYLLDNTGAPIRHGDNFQSKHRYICQNEPTPGANADCTDVATPFPCCTGPGAGTCDGFDSTCFNDVFRAQIACPRDDGVSIGVGLRTLLFNKFKADRLSAGNGGTFEP